MLRRRRSVGVHADQQLELLQSAQGLCLIWEGHQRIASHTQKPSNLTLSRLEDLVGERGGRHLADHLAEAAYATPGSVAVRRTRPHHLSAARQRGSQDPGVRDTLAFAIHATADHIQRDHEMLREVGARRHVRAGSGAGDSARAFREQACGFGDLDFGDSGTASGHLLGEGLDGVSQRLHSVGVVGAEVVVRKTLAQNHAQHPSEQSRVLARPHRQMEVRAPGHFGTSRINADHLHPSPLRIAQTLGGVEGRDSAVRRVLGDQRVAADDHHDVRAFEAVGARTPKSRPRQSHELARLIDGDARIEGRRGDATMPRLGNGQGDRVLERVRSTVGRHRPRAGCIEDSTHTFGDLVEGFLRRHLLELAIGAPPQRRSQARRMLHHLGELTTLDAHVAAVDRVGPIAPNC